MVKRHKLTIKITKADDIQYLCNQLRQADVNELTACCSDPLTSLSEGYIFSDECYTAYVDNEPAGMFGVASNILPENMASIWFLGTDKMSLVPKEWIRTGRYYINHFLLNNPVLTNMVSTENKLHIKWLEKMGAIFSAPIEFNNHQFLQFYIIN